MITSGIHAGLINNLTLSGRWRLFLKVFDGDVILLLIPFQAVLAVTYLSAMSWHPWFPAARWEVLAPGEQMLCCRNRWHLQSKNN